MKFDVGQMRSWESTKPWNLSVEDAQRQMVPGWKYGERQIRSEVATWYDGWIIVHPPFFTYPEGVRRVIAYHEAGHAMFDAFGIDKVQAAFGVDPLDLIDLPGGQTLGNNPDEVIAEGYSVLWDEPSWFERMHADEILGIVLGIAKATGWPLPPGVRTAALDSHLYWRTHPNGRPFSVDDATSTTFHGGRFAKGYSCFASPWHLWLYMDAMRWYEQAKTQDIIGFSGERVGTGNDGEDLVVPDMKTVDRMSLAEFEKEMVSTPMPPTPTFGPGWDGYSSWSTLAKTWLRQGFFEMGQDPVIDQILRRATAVTAVSWRGLMSGPIWTDYPACIIVDQGGMGRQSYEVYIGGEARPRCQRLQDAKDYIEAQIGPCTFERVRPELQKADHYFLGPTTEFTDPTIVYAAIPS